MTHEFDYLIDEIEQASFEESPFRHVEIHSFLSDAHFEAIISAPEIALARADNDRGLCDSLLAMGYEPIKFPGCTTSIDRYLQWRDGKGDYENVDTCEGFGIAFRLSRTSSELITTLNEFLASEPFLSALSAKFGIERNAVFPDVGIQKYLDGYEISPHPDIRKKALTFMVNINPAPASEALDFHTHYLRFREEKRYVQEFWRHNPAYDRSWVPWSWCESVKQQTANNSIVIFSPGYNSMHAVRARYDHLLTQRTQLYGNLWYGERQSDDVRDAPIVDLPQIPWQGLVIDETRGRSQVMVGQGSLVQKAVRLGGRLLGRSPR